jgi:hypothetical protein
MKTLNYILKTVEFLKSFNLGTKANAESQTNLELTYTKFGLISKKDANTGKTSNTLLSQLYSEENETLFI